tara:strand:+ start:5129 stop:5776 length:648 start_codon:yes stop_codon:yes gene_type:complete
LKRKIKSIKISCDGGAATGKSTGAKMIAKKYKLKFLSSGLLYRYASYLIIKHKPNNKVIFLKEKFKKLNYDRLKKINLHTAEISEYSANIAKILSIRKILKNFQIKFIRKNKNCVLEGRDASTKIMPESDLKFFFICNKLIAAKRRFKELKKHSKNIQFNDVRKALVSRDKKDRSRRFSPLQRHPDAITVDSGKLNKRAMLKKMSNHVEKVLSKK